MSRSFFLTAAQLRSLGAEGSAEDQEIDEADCAIAIQIEPR